MATVKILSQGKVSNIPSRTQSCYKLAFRNSKTRYNYIRYVLTSM